MKAAAFSSTVRYHRLVMAAAMVAIATTRMEASFIGTYVGAVPGPGGNTVRTSDGDTGSQSTWLNDGVHTWGDTQWLTVPSGAFTGATGSTIVANNQARTVGTSAPELTMTVATPDPYGIYNVYVVYETDDTTAGGSTPIAAVPYDIHAGLSAGSLNYYDDTSGGYTGGNRLISPTRFLNEREVLVGTASGASLSFFVDDSVQPSGGIQNNTRWEGLAFEETGQFPEPSTLALALVGGLLAYGRRPSRA